MVFVTIGLLLLKEQKFRKHYKIALRTITDKEGNTLDDRNYGIHSFRIGGATERAWKGQSLKSIKSAGFWRSNCVRSYFRLYNPDLTQFYGLANGTTVGNLPTWIAPFLKQSSRDDGNLESDLEESDQDYDSAVPFTATAMDLMEEKGIESGKSPAVLNRRKKKVVIGVPSEFNHILAHLPIPSFRKPATMSSIKPMAMKSPLKPKNGKRSQYVYKYTKRTPSSSKQSNLSTLPPPPPLEEVDDVSN